MVVDIKDTIAAISTPIGLGGIGVVRLSGPDSQRIAKEIFTQRPPKKNNSKPVSPVTEKNHFLPRNAYHGYIADHRKSESLDEVLLISMPGPHSYTREDVIEIQSHGGMVVLKTILDLIIEKGARLANAGEFTKRAYLNGRIDLSQAEAVIDIIQAKTEAALKIASKHLEGYVKVSVQSLKEMVLDVHAMMEADIEFPEDMEDCFETDEKSRKILTEVEKKLDEILDGYRRGHVYRDGLRLTIVGKVNVGKSSLMNRFLMKERSIVTDIPGTTRDHIEETLDINGLPVILIDTAGWHDTTDPVERIGIERARDLAQKADLILFMVDAERGVSKDDQEIYDRIHGKSKIIVINKTDLLTENQKIDIPETWLSYDTVRISVKHGFGIDQLKNTILRFGTEGWDGPENAIVPNLRQKELFQKALKGIHGAKACMEASSPELTVIELQEVAASLDEVTGIYVKGDVLDTVFSRFCIGK